MNENNKFDKETMKKTVFTMILFAAFSTLAFGQKGRAPMGKGNGWKNPEVRADSNARRMQRNVGLSQDQYQQVKAANLTYFNAVAANRETYKGNKAGMKAANKAAYEQRENSLKNILTADQYSKLATYRSDVKAKKAKRKQAGKGKPADKGKPANGDNGDDTDPEESDD